MNKSVFYNKNPFKLIMLTSAYIGKSAADFGELRSTHLSRKVK